MLARRKWSKEDITRILEHKKQGLKLSAIGLHFKVSGNAVRKALQRHSVFYMKCKRNSNIESENVTFSQALEWVKNNCDNSIINIDFKDRIKGIILINQKRIKLGLPKFCIRNHI